MAQFEFGHRLPNSHGLRLRNKQILQSAKTILSEANSGIGTDSNSWLLGIVQLPNSKIMFAIMQRSF